MAELMNNPLGPQPDFQLVSQAHQNLADEMRKISNIPQLNAVDTILAAFNQKFDIIIRRLDRLDGRMDGLERRMDGLERRMDGLERRMDGLERRMDGLERQQQTR
jgi:chromosome segregation ATPase